MSGLEEGASLALTNDGSGWMLEPQMIGGSGLSFDFFAEGNYSVPMFSLENNNNIAIQGYSQQSQGIRGISRRNQFINFGSLHNLINYETGDAGAGVLGEAFPTVGQNDGIGVWGRAVSLPDASNQGFGLGGFFQGNFTGVAGIAGARAWAGVWGVGGTVDVNVYTAGVRGDANGADWGGYFEGTSGQNGGLAGIAFGAQFGGLFEGPSIANSGFVTAGLFADRNGSDYAAIFDGNVLVVNGTINKSATNFKIDHPQDPENKYLVHTAMESPDMKNLYDGIIVTDNNGFATVELPGYFEALNKDFRYQLTVIGTFAQAIIKEKITGNRFVIQTSEPNVEVSWQVTGVRKDPYAEANRTIPEIEKEGHEKGKYLHPHLYGQPDTKSILYNEEHEQQTRLNRTVNKE